MPINYYKQFEISDSEVEKIKLLTEKNIMNCFSLDTELTLEEMEFMEKHAKIVSTNLINSYKREMTVAKNISNPIESLKEQLWEIAFMLRYSNSFLSETLELAAARIKRHIEKKPSEPFTIIRESWTDLTHLPDHYISKDDIDFVINQLGLEIDKEDNENFQSSELTYYKLIDNLRFFRQKVALAKKGEIPGLQEGVFLEALGLIVLQNTSK